MMNFEEKTMEKKKRTPTPAPAPSLAFEAVILPDNAGEDAPDGYPLALVPFGYEDERPMAELTARIAITARIRPHDLVRVDGKWFLEFSILSPDAAPGEAASGPVFGVEVGGAGSLPFGDALALVCGAGGV